jgi:hypothetical protein
MTNKREVSLTFLDLCDKIILYDGLSIDVIESIRHEIIDDLISVMHIKSTDVEPYLADSVIDIKNAIVREFGVPIHANLSGSTWPEVQHV